MERFHWKPDAANLLRIRLNFELACCGHRPFAAARSRSVEVTEHQV